MGVLSDIRLIISETVGDCLHTGALMWMLGDVLGDLTLMGRLGVFTVLYEVSKGCLARTPGSFFLVLSGLLYMVMVSISCFWLLLGVHTGLFGVSLLLGVPDGGWALVWGWVPWCV